MAAFAGLYLQAVREPRRVMSALVAEPKRVRFGAYAVAVVATAYTCVYFFLSRNGGRPTVFQPWLAIEAESYYRYNLYLHAPSIVLAWVSAAGFTELAARALGGKGSFEDTLAVLGFGIGVASWWTGLHDLVTSFLGFAGAIDQRAYEDAMSSATPARTFLWILMFGYLAWFILMFTSGVRAAHRLSVARSLASGTLGVLAYHAVFLIFNR